MSRTQQVNLRGCDRVSKRRVRKALLAESLFLNKVDGSNEKGLGLTPSALCCLLLPLTLFVFVVALFLSFLEDPFVLPPVSVSGRIFGEK
jgi:hypothetical protein